MKLRQQFTDWDLRNRKLLEYSVRIDDYLFVLTPEGKTAEQFKAEVGDAIKILMEAYSKATIAATRGHLKEVGRQLSDMVEFSEQHGGLAGLTDVTKAILANAIVNSTLKTGKLDAGEIRFMNNFYQLGTKYGLEVV